MGGAQETGNSWMEDEGSSLDEKVRLSLEDVHKKKSSQNRSKI
jgi:hypothetical protein